MQSIPSLRVSCTSLLISSLLASGTWGCAALPKTGVEASGEPLNVEVRTETHTYTTQAKVGEVVNKDSSGRVVGTSEVYENRTGTYDVTRWQAFQGDSPIDDQDFFRIGGDVETAKEIAASRQSGVTMNKIGVGLLIGGGALALTGIVAANAITTTDPNTGIETSPGWALPLMTGGMLTLAVGGVLTWIGIAKVKREHPIDDPARANAVAKKYNARLDSAPAAKEEEEEEEEEPPPPPKKKKKKKK